MPIYRSQFQGGLAPVSDALAQLGAAAGYEMSPQGQLDDRIARIRNIQMQKILQSPTTYASKSLGGFMEGTPEDTRNKWQIVINPEDPSAPMYYRGIGEQTSNVPGPGWVPDYASQLQGRLDEQMLQAMLDQQQQQQSMRRQGGTPGWTGAMHEYQTGGEVGARQQQGGNQQLEQLKQLLGLDRGEVPIVAHQGEYVMNRGAVDAIGEDKLQALNQLGKQMPSYEQGGFVLQGEQVKEPPKSRGTRSGNQGQQGNLGLGDAGVTNWEFTPPQNVNDIERALRLAEQTRDLQQKEAYVRRAEQLQAAEQHVPDIPDASKLVDPSTLSRQGARPMEEVESAEQAKHRAQTARDPQAREKAAQRTEELNQRTTFPLADQILTEFIQKGGLQNPEMQPKPPLSPEVIDEQAQQGIRDNMSPAQRKPQQEVNVQSKQKQSQASESLPPTKEGDRPSSEPQPQQRPPVDARELDIGFRQPGQTMDIPWARISEMDPGQAAQVLQRYASTQGDLFPGPTVGPQGRVQQQQMPKSQQLFQSLMNQYNMIKEAEGAEASQLFTEARTEGQKLENKWSKMSRPQRIQQLKLQVEKLAAKKPYWKDIAQKELDTLEADELKTLAQAAYYTQRADQQAIKIQNMSPAEMMDAISKGVNIKQEKLKTLRDDMESLQERAKQTGAQSDKKMAAQKAIEYGIASGALPPQVSYENYKDRLQEIGGVFSKEKILSKQEFNRAKAQGMTHRSQIDRIEAISSRLGTPSRGQSGQMTGQGQGMQAAGQGQPANPSSMNPEQMQNLSVQDWQNILMQQMAQQGVGGQ